MKNHQQGFCLQNSCSVLGSSFAKIATRENKKITQFAKM